MKPKIFVSCFQLDPSYDAGRPLCRRPEYFGLRLKAVEFIEALIEKGYEVNAPLVWQGYPTIEKQIDESDALVALIDKDWFSSIWKCSELTYASDGMGALETKANHKTVPAFVFYLDEVLDTWIEHPDRTWVSLPLEHQAAVETICQHIPA